MTAGSTKYDSATQLSIRRAGTEDAPAIANVLHDSFLEFKPLYTEGGFLATTPGVEQILARMREGPVWIALRGNVILGTVAAVVKGEHLYVRGMAVLPAERGSGVGRTLLRQVEGWAKDERRSRLLLSTTPFLSSAIHLYEKFGYRQIDGGPHDLFGTPLITMEKTISR